MRHKTGIRRLTTQLVLSILLLIFLPSAIALTALVYTIRSDFKEQAVSNALVQIENKSTSTVNALNLSIASLRLLGSGIEKELNAAQDTALRMSTEDPPAAWPDMRLYRKVYKLLKSELIMHAGVTEARIINSTGTELIRLILTPSGVKEKTAGELENKAHRGYFKNTMALSGTDVYLHPVTLQKEYRKTVRPYMPVLRISTKLTVADKVSFGMVVINIRPEFILGRQPSEADSGFLIADEKGNYLVHWDKSVLWGGDLGLSVNFLADEPEMKKAMALRGEFLNKDAAIQYDKEHDEYHAWKKIYYNKNDRSRYWLFFQRHPLESIEAPWGGSATIGLAGFILIILSGFGLIVLIIKKTLEPLPHVARAMKSLEDGDLSARADTQSRSEIGEIAHAFNSMADWLENYRRQLQKSMAVSSAMSDATPNAHIIIKQNGTILSANRATERIFGYTPDELKGRDVKTLMPRPYNEKGEDYVWDYLEGGADSVGELGTVELNAMRKSGEVFKVSVYLGEAEIGEEGVFVAVIEDITERKRAEAALLENEAKYYNLFKSANDAIYLVDPVTARILDCNQKAAEMDGYSIEELKGMTILDLHPEEERRLLPGVFKDIMDKGSVIGMSYFHHKRKDGSLRPIEVNATIIEIGGKRLNLSVVRDITERKQAEEELRASEIKYRTLMDNASDAIGITDMDGTILEVNGQMEKLTGYTKDELIGKKFPTLLPKKAAGRAFKSFKRVTEGGSGPLFEGAVIRKDGAEVPIEVTSKVVEYEGRRAMQSIIRDITERKRAEYAVNHIAMGVSAETGDDFFRSLVMHLAENLESAYAFVGELTGEKKDRINTIAVCVDGEIKDNFEYVLEGTPCINVVGKVPCVYPENVQQEFPEDHMLVEMGVESYMGTPLFDSKGNALGLLVVMDRRPLENQNIAESMLQIFAARAAAELERKRAEEELRLSEEKYRAIFEQASDSIILVDPETGEMVAYNARAHENLGYTREEFARMRISDFEVVESPEEVEKHMKKIAKEGEDVFETKQRTKSGEIRDVLVNARLISIGDRKFFQGLVSDITERKQAEEQLSQNFDLLNSITGAQLQFIADAPRDAVFDDLLKTLLDLTDSEYGFIGEILHKDDGTPYLKTHTATNIAWNEETRKFYEKHAATGLEFYNLKTLFGKVITSGEKVISNSPSDDPRRGGLPKGHPPLNSFMGLPFYKGDRLEGMIGIANRPGGYDDELAEYLEPFLATCSSLMEAFKIEKKRKQAEEALIEAKKVAEETSETKTRFVAKTNHELRGPLTSIISMLKLVLAGKCENPEQEKEFLKNVYNSSIHMRGLIENLLNLSVLDIGKMKLNMKVVPFDQLLELVRQITWMQAREKGLELTFTCNCAEDDRMIYCDSDRLRELVVNLVGNAIKFTEKGSIGVSCLQPADGKMRELEIVDTGIGIEPERQKGLFEPFSQIDGARYGGAGLGLTVAKKFVERMGGDISIYSKGLGHGTKVTISLPHAPAVKKKKTPKKKQATKKS